MVWPPEDECESEVKHPDSKPGRIGWQMGWVMVSVGRCVGWAKPVHTTGGRLSSWLGGEWGQGDIRVAAIASTP